MAKTTRRDFLSTLAISIISPAIASSQTRVDTASIRTLAGWQKAREKILANMQLVMGELPKNSRL
jgi:hypothetical protein